MPSFEPNTTSVRADSDVSADTSDTDIPAASKNPASQEQIERWAGLVAVGQVEFPDHLDPHDTYRLAKAIRRKNRRSLVQLIAHSIAEDIAGDLQRR